MKRLQWMIACLALLPTLASFTGCGDAKSSQAPSQLGRAYVFGDTTGEMSDQVARVLRPDPWAGQPDGTLVVQAAAVQTMSDQQQGDLRALAAAGQGVVLLEARNVDIAALHAIMGTVVPMEVPSEAVGERFAVYVAGQSSVGARAGSVLPFPHPSSLEHDSRKLERVTGVLTHVLEKLASERHPSNALATTADVGLTTLSPSNLPLETTQSYSMPADWATCGQQVHTCSVDVQVFFNAWMVHSATNAATPGQPTDFFVITTSANVNTGGCYEFYGRQNDADRIAGYWLRQFNTGAEVSSAAVPSVPFSDLNVASGPPSQGGYAPQQANPSEQVTTGTTWGVGGTGTAGSENSLGFFAGVEFTNQTSVSYPALQTNVDIGSTANDTIWSYDSWNFVKSGITPQHQDCSGSGLNVASALPGIVYGGTFNPAQTWVWQAQPTVRQLFGGGPLPVQLGTSALLGWAFYGTQSPCSPVYPYAYSYYLPNSVTYTTGQWLSSGLNFDVACDTTLNFGTIPLGPRGPQNQDDDAGNPGNPFAFPVLMVNVPFAPIPTAAQLGSLSPATGSAGTPVTITGTNLAGVGVVNFGGVSIADFTILSATQLQVAAPAGPTGNVPVSVQNAAGFSNTLTFTYGGQEAQSRDLS